MQTQRRRAAPIHTRWFPYMTLSYSVISALNRHGSCGKPSLFIRPVRMPVFGTPLYNDLMQNFGKRRVVSIPWWTLRSDGHKSRMPRNCTLDYKVAQIAKFLRWEVLGYRKGQKLRDEDRKAHEMHMGFSFEERHRCKESPNPMLTNHFPLVEMKLTRADNYAYILDAWGLDTKASACCFCRWPDSSFLCPAMRFSVSDFANTNPPAPEKSRGDRCLAASPFFMLPVRRSSRGRRPARPRRSFSSGRSSIARAYRSPPPDIGTDACSSRAPPPAR